MFCLEQSQHKSFFPSPHSHPHPCTTPLGFAQKWPGLEKTLAPAEVFFIHQILHPPGHPALCSHSCRVHGRDKGGYLQDIQPAPHNYFAMGACGAALCLTPHGSSRELLRTPRKCAPGFSHSQQTGCTETTAAGEGRICIKVGRQYKFYCSLTFEYLALQLQYRVWV